MKRSRRVVLTLMGSAALGVISEKLEARPFDCGPGMTAVPGPDGRPYCRATYGGFGGTLHHEIREIPGRMNHRMPRLANGDIHPDPPSSSPIVSGRVW